MFTFVKAEASLPWGHVGGHPGFWTYSGVPRLSHPSRCELLPRTAGKGAVFCFGFGLFANKLKGLVHRTVHQGAVMILLNCGAGDFWESLRFNSLSRVWLFVTSWTAARQASLTRKKSKPKEGCWGLVTRLWTRRWWLQPRRTPGWQQLVQTFPTLSFFSLSSKRALKRFTLQNMR